MRKKKKKPFPFSHPILLRNDAGSSEDGADQQEGMGEEQGAAAVRAPWLAPRRGQHERHQHDVDADEEEDSDKSGRLKFQRKEGRKEGRKENYVRGEE